MYKAPEPMMITVKNHGKTLTAELPWDSGLEDIFEAINGLLVGTGWRSEWVVSGFKEYAEDRMPEESKNTCECGGNCQCVTKEIKTED